MLPGMEGGMHVGRHMSSVDRLRSIGFILSAPQRARVGKLERLAKPLRAELSDFFVKPKSGEKPPVPFKAGRRPRA
jgi:hypothetical protein